MGTNTLSPEACGNGWSQWGPTEGNLLDAYLTLGACLTLDTQAGPILPNRIRIPWAPGLPRSTLSRNSCSKILCPEIPGSPATGNFVNLANLANLEVSEFTNLEVSANMANLEAPAA